MELTRNFTLAELIKSDTAIRKGINNNPNAEQIEKLKTLCEKILQPVRDHFGRVKITSGYRSPELCVAIGSSLNSQYARAEAADFEVVGVDNCDLADWIVTGKQFQNCFYRHQEGSEFRWHGAETKRKNTDRRFASAARTMGGASRRSLASGLAFPFLNLPARLTRPVATTSRTTQSSTRLCGIAARC